MGLFDKKTCEICGEKASMIGKKKIQDGYLCSDCKKKLSSFSEGWRQRSADEVRQHLAEREANKEKYAQFVVSQSLGPRQELKIDQTHGWFYVASGRDWKQENPEVFQLAQIKEYYIEVDFDPFSDDDDDDGIPDHLERGRQGVHASVGMRRGGSLNADTVQQMVLNSGLSGYFRIERGYDNDGYPREVDGLKCVIHVNHPFISKVWFSTSHFDADDPSGSQQITKMSQVIRGLQMVQQNTNMAAGMQGGMPAGMQGGMPGGMQGGMPGGMQGGMQGGMPGGMQGGMPAGMQGGMQNQHMPSSPHGAGMPPQAQVPSSTPHGQPGQGGKFCSGCGAPLTGTPFCASCGAPAQ